MSKTALIHKGGVIHHPSDDGDLCFLAGKLWTVTGGVSRFTGAVVCRTHQISIVYVVVYRDPAR